MGRGNEARGCELRDRGSKPVSAQTLSVDTGSRGTDQT